jgi:hypothetical protein
MPSPPIFPAARLIRPGRNLGFARANNVAAAEAKGQWLLLLNPDTVILDGAIDRAVQFAQRGGNDVRIIGGRTCFADGRLNRNSCHGVPTPWSVFCIGLGLSSLFRARACSTRRRWGRGRGTPCGRLMQLPAASFSYRGRSGFA